MNLSKKELRKQFNLFIVIIFLLLLHPFELGFSFNKAIANQSFNSQTNLCPAANLLPKRTFETAQYRIHICRGEKASSLGYYVSMNKNGSNNPTKEITLPVNKVIGETYIAINSETAYAITPYELIVAKNGNILQTERVITAYSGDGKSIAWNCLEGESRLVEAETKNFMVLICSGDNANNYVAIDKKTNKKIVLPLLNENLSETREAIQYVAVNGNVIYVITPRQLRVTLNGKTVLRERILRWDLSDYRFI